MRISGSFTFAFKSQTTKLWVHGEDFDSLMADANGKIDFNAVGDATKLKPPAARMRYTRLRRAIEGGTLIGTHGTPFQGGAEKVVEVRKKRKGHTHGSRAEEEDDPEPIVTRSGGRNMRSEDGSAGQYETEQSTGDEKAPSLKGRARALKREVDADEEKAVSASELLRSGQHQQDYIPHAQSRCPKVEREGDMDSTNDWTAESKQPAMDSGREDSGAINLALAPQGLLQPFRELVPWSQRGLTLKREADEILSTGATTARTRLILKVEDGEKKVVCGVGMAGTSGSE